MKTPVFTPPLETLITERLIIEPLSLSEFQEKRDSGFGDADFQEAMEELAERAKADRPARFAWYTNRLIYKQDGHTYIGSIACMNSPEKDPDHIGLVEIGYSCEEAYRGNGYMTEAVDALCTWVLAQKKVYGLIAGVVDGNPASERILVRCGFEKTDHSDTLSLSVYKRIPDGRRPMHFWQRWF